MPLLSKKSRHKMPFITVRDCLTIRKEMVKIVVADHFEEWVINISQTISHECT